MSAGDRKVLELVAYAQLSPSEAALALGISPNAARLRLARARRRLRERLQPSKEVSSHDH
jgi:DNA-directed RNA polymerase specialized sigma24 family protein